MIEKKVLTERQLFLLNEIRHLSKSVSNWVDDVEEQIPFSETMLMTKFTALQETIFEYFDIKKH